MGPEKRKKAENLNVSIISEEEFISMLNGAKEKDDSKKEKQKDLTLF